MIKNLSFLLLSTLLFSSYSADVTNSSPKSVPQVLWYAQGNRKLNPKIGETTVAFAFWAKQKKDFIYMRVEEGVDKKLTGKGIIGYESAFDREKALKALRDGTFLELYKTAPITPSLEPKRSFLIETAREALEGKNETTSPELENFCSKVEQQLDLVNRGVAVPT